LENFFAAKFKIQLYSGNNRQFMLYLYDKNKLEIEV